MNDVVLLTLRQPTGRTWVEDPKSLTRFTFTLQAIRSTPFSHTPNNLGDGPFIFVDSGTFVDPLTVYSIHQTDFRSISDPSPECGPLCGLRESSAHSPSPRIPSPDAYVMSDSDDDEFPEVEVLIERPLPPARTLRLEMEPIRAIPIAQAQVESPIPRNLAASPDDLAPPHAIVTLSVRRQQWQQEATATAVKVSTTTPFIAGPLLTSAMELSVTVFWPLCNHFKPDFDGVVLGG
ncbi:hypothetical protein B0H14DRAFT_3436262 [Mycena olivaceomarginata]|nr:hypothetical protein B0H14DRAFT_3436262 [Mycena olivaceomarginata]